MAGAAGEQLPGSQPVRGIPVLKVLEGLMQADSEWHDPRQEATMPESCTTPGVSVCGRDDQSVLGFCQVCAGYVLVYVLALGTVYGRDMSTQGLLACMLGGPRWRQAERKVTTLLCQQLTEHWRGQQPGEMLGEWVKQEELPVRQSCSASTSTAICLRAWSIAVDRCWRLS